MPFLLLLTLGAFALFMTTAGNNIAIMRSVPREHRSFALALATLGAHLFGDVPSPIVLGALEDSLAPKCVPEYDDDGGDGDFAIGPECASQRSKLRFTWLLCVLWLGWAVLGFGLAWLIVFRRHRGAAKRATGDGLPELHVQRRAHDDDDDDDDEDEPGSPSRVTIQGIGPLLGAVGAVTGAILRAPR